MIGIIALPAIFGTVIALLILMPMPQAFAYGHIAGALFWIPAAVGTLLSRELPTDGAPKLELGWIDIALLLAMILLVRLMVNGITFTP
jgi:hypothetical protein